MSRWTADSDDDYQDAVEARHTYPRDDDQPETVQAVCASCGGWFETVPEQPVTICRACGALHDLTAQRAKDRGAA